jgi:hypothetical protein
MAAVTVTEKSHPFLVLAMKEIAYDGGCPQGDYDERRRCPMCEVILFGRHTFTNFSENELVQAEFALRQLPTEAITEFAIGNEEGDLYPASTFGLVLAHKILDVFFDGPEV